MVFEVNVVYRQANDGTDVRVSRGTVVAVDAPTAATLTDSHCRLVMNAVEMISIELTAQNTDDQGTYAYARALCD